MDPKMDSGCLDEGETFDSDYDVSRPLSKEEVVGIMDRMLAHEVGQCIEECKRLREYNIC